MEGTTSIKKLVDEIGLLQRQVDSLDRVEECCCVAGLTGSGKSALICYLCKGELMVNRRMGRFIITHNNDRLPVIGNRMESETKTLNLFTTPDSMVLYDPPGFASTEGGFQEILDSYSNAKMFKIGSKVRIVIVVDCHTVLAGRGGGFVEVARRLH